MALARWDPFQEMTSLRDAVDRLFEESFVMPRRLGFETPAGMGFPLDVVEREDSYEVKATLPGLKPEDVDITITGNTLNIRGERKEEREEKEGSYLLREIRYGTFARSITLPVPVDAEHCEARLENGVLTLSVPKAEEAKPKRIKVRTQQALGGGEQARELGKGKGS